MKITEINSCRICGGKNLNVVLDLGELYPSNFITQEDSSDNYDKAPLVLVQCSECDLVQLKHEVTPDNMYRQYWYKSNLNKSMVEDLKDIVENVESRIKLGHDTVVDIGCNDGTLFKQYTSPYIAKIGYDPALNLEEDAKKNCDLFINDYFSANKFPARAKKAKVITSIAMFYDLPNPNIFVEDIKRILDDDGIWVIQMTDLSSMFLLNAFDNICHEHLEYYSLYVLMGLLNKFDLQIFDLGWNHVNGGSLRVYVSHKNKYPISKNVHLGLMREEIIFTNKNGNFSAFKNRIEIIKNRLSIYIANINAGGYKIFGLGASTKGNTLLQLYGLDNKIIPCIAEVNPNKFLLKTIGTEITIIPEQEAEKKNPDYYLLLPWHFISMIVDKHIGYLVAGGRIITPLPTPTMYYYEKGDIKVKSI